METRLFWQQKVVREGLSVMASMDAVTTSHSRFAKPCSTASVLAYQRKRLALVASSYCAVSSSRMDECAQMSSSCSTTCSMEDTFVVVLEAVRVRKAARFAVYDVSATCMVERMVEPGKVGRFAP
jgi:hypothetical protein